MKGVAVEEEAGVVAVVADYKRSSKCKIEDHRGLAPHNIRLRNHNDNRGALLLRFDIEGLHKNWLEVAVVVGAAYSYWYRL